MGRPSEFSPETANEICRLISEGESLRKLCERDEFPSLSTVMRWLDGNEAFREQYAHARTRQADTFAEKLVDEAFDAKDAALGRLRMDALKWAAAKLAPKKYGEKVAHVGGDEDDAPIKSELKVEFV